MAATGIAIRVDGRLEDITIDGGHTHQMKLLQALVRGDVEAITWHPSLTIMFCETGRLDHMMPNPKATALAAAMNLPVDDLVGTTVVTGPVDNHGGFTNITDEIRNLIESFELVERLDD